MTFLFLLALVFLAVGVPPHRYQVSSIALGLAFLAMWLHWPQALPL